MNPTIFSLRFPWMRLGTFLAFVLSLCSAHAVDEGIVVLTQTSTNGAAGSTKSYPFAVPQGASKLVISGRIMSGYVGCSLKDVRFPNDGGTPINLGSRGTITATDVAPGNYNFEVIGATLYYGFSFEIRAYGPTLSLNYLWSEELNDWIKPVDNTVLWITPEPKMPYIATVNWVSGYTSTSPAKSYWRFACSFPNISLIQKHEPSTKRFPASGHDVINYSSYWDVSRSWIGDDFFGGEVSIWGGNDVFGLNNRLDFQIKGKNPKDAVVRAFLRRQKARWFSYALFAHESRRGKTIYNHFFPMKWRGFAGGRSGVLLEGIPLWGYPEGRGMAQIDYSHEKKRNKENKKSTTLTSGKFKSELTSKEFWNWKSNLLLGLDRIEEKRRLAEGYFTAVKAANPKTWEEPSVPIEYVDKVPNGATAIDIATIELYNSGYTSVKVSGKVYPVAYLFDSKASPGKRWKFMDNGQKYVEKFFEEYTRRHKTVDD